MSTSTTIPEESQLHLKRNRACLRCKKRKIKCDGVRPTCLPCTRAASSIRRGSDLPNIGPADVQCVWADEVEHQDEGGPSAKPGMTRKKVSGRVVSQAQSKMEDQQAERMAILEEERDHFKARLAQLEARLEAMSTPSSQQDNIASSSFTDNHSFDLSNRSSIPYLPLSGDGIGLGSNSIYDIPVSVHIPQSQPVQPVPEPIWMTPEVDYSQLFMVPYRWPKNLPAPYLLEHLVETFFNCVPQVPRMIHRAKLLGRIHLPPTHPNFPTATLLHAICAAAAPYTAWVNSLPLHAINASVDRIYQNDASDLEDSEDFGISQAEASRRAYHRSYHRLWQDRNQNDKTLQILQAQAILIGVWHSRGLFGAGGACLGDALRLVKELELTNRVQCPDGVVTFPTPPLTDIEREERLATVWYVFMFEAFFATGAAWTGGLDDRILMCNLPAGSKEFREALDRIEENPQDARTADLFAIHPVADPYALACKAALLCARTKRSLREWAQRRRIEGDTMLGLEREDFRQVYYDLVCFQQTLPDSVKNIFRHLNSTSQRIVDCNVLAVHLMPNIAIMMLHQPFIDWEQPHIYGLPPILKAIDTIMAILHLIPSNFDVSLVMNGVLTYNLRFCADIINQVSDHAAKKQSYAQAIRYKADHDTIKDLLKRLSSKHAVAFYFMAAVEGSLRWRDEGTLSVESAPKDASPGSSGDSGGNADDALIPVPVSMTTARASAVVGPEVEPPCPPFSINGQIVDPKAATDTDFAGLSYDGSHTAYPIPHIEPNMPMLADPVPPLNSWTSGEPLPTPVSAYPEPSLRSNEHLGSGPVLPNGGGYVDLARSQQDTFVWR